MSTMSTEQTSVKERFSPGTSQIVEEAVRARWRPHSQSSQFDTGDVVNLVQQKLWEKIRKDPESVPRHDVNHGRDLANLAKKMARNACIDLIRSATAAKRVPEGGRVESIVDEPRGRLTSPSQSLEIKEARSAYDERRRDFLAQLGEREGEAVELMIDAPKKLKLKEVQNITGISVVRLCKLRKQYFEQVWVEGDE